MDTRTLCVLFLTGLLPACGGSVSNAGTGGTGAAGTAAVGGGGANGGTSGGGGSGGSVGGSGGFGGTPAPKVGKLDLLLMVDDSIGTASQQALLDAAIPNLISLLVMPPVDPATGQPPYQPVQDLHIGVITSSIGSHGGDQCSPSSSNWDPAQDDNAHLLPSVRGGLTSYNGEQFLWWDPTQTKANPPGETSLDTLVSELQATVVAAGDHGCGYEAQLESWYRFLIDPNPPTNVTNDGISAVIQAPDQTVLHQRADFLRPDSAVAILMLTNENDCSIKDGGYNWLAAETANADGSPYVLAQGTNSCKTDPDDPCCQSCLEALNPGCPPLLQNGCDVPQNPALDHPNLRCWDQKRRFGIDFLYSTDRYVEGLTSPTLHTDWTGDTPGGNVVENPLFAGGRHPGLVFLAGIVGVPWQDIATPDSLNDPNALELMSAEELAANGRWPLLLPDSGTDPPDDPLMIESTAERTGANPVTGAALVGDDGGELANPINGHEYQTASGTPAVASDLQYACIFPLGTPEPLGNDCTDAATSHSPLCQQGGTYGTTQYYDKAYPGTRELRVLRDIGPQAVVGSVCAKLTDPAAPAYGYNPAMHALAQKLGSVLLP